MAKMISQSIVITVSKIVKDSASENAVLPEEFAEAIEQMVAEVLQDPAALIEVIEAD